MTGKPVARLGDKTDHGGTIVTASGTFSAMGKKVARVGDMVECPKCKGTYPIITGAIASFEQGKQVAVVGSRTACGATIITGLETFTIGDPIGVAATTQSNVYGMGALRELRGPFPGKNIPMKELCRAIKDVKNAPQIKEVLRDVVNMTIKNKKEYGGWIIEDPAGMYKVEKIIEGEDMEVDLGDKPPKAIANFHTHPNSLNARSSPRDEETAAYAEDKCLFHLILSSSGDEAYINDEGKSIECPDQKPLFEGEQFDLFQR